MLASASDMAASDGSADAQERHDARREERRGVEVVLHQFGRDDDVSDRDLGAERARDAAEDEAVDVVSDDEVGGGGGGGDLSQAREDDDEGHAVAGRVDEAAAGAIVETRVLEASDECVDLFGHGADDADGHGTRVERVSAVQGCELERRSNCSAKRS